MAADNIGLPQFAALLILLQRGLEELHSRQNTRRLLEQGAHETGRDYYPVVAVTHLSWIASIAFLTPSNASHIRTAVDCFSCPSTNAILDYRHTWSVLDASNY